MYSIYINNRSKHLPVVTKDTLELGQYKPNLLRVNVMFFRIINKTWIDDRWADMIPFSGKMHCIFVKDCEDKSQAK